MNLFWKRRDPSAPEKEACLRDREGRSWNQTPVLPLRPKWAIKLITKRTTKMKNKSFAIPAAATAIPPNPKTAAMIAITKNIKAQ
jgi:hypothetical protein